MSSWVKIDPNNLPKGEMLCKDELKEYMVGWVFEEEIESQS